MTIKSSLYAMTALLILSNQAFASDNKISFLPDVGDVEAVIKDANMVYEDESIALIPQSDLRENTVIATGAEARVHAVLSDGTKLMVGENSNFEINKFVLGENANAEFKVAKGVFRVITGSLNKTGGQMKLVTPAATIGIRGTDFWGLQTEEKLTLALIDNGSLEVTTPDGRIIEMNDPMTVVVIETNGTVSDVSSLSQEALAEAAKTVLLPE